MKASDDDADHETPQGDGRPLEPRLSGLDDNDERFSQLPEASTAGHVPALNITENEDSLVVSVDLPGVEAKDVVVEVMGKELVISGERKWESEKTEGEMVHMESRFGAFRRVVSLPTGLETEADDVDATYEDGILKVRLKKVEPTPTRKVTVKNG